MPSPASPGSRASAVDLSHLWSHLPAREATSWPVVGQTTQTTVLDPGADQSERHGVGSASLIDVANLCVPGIGTFEELDDSPFALVRDPSGTEIEFISIALALLDGVVASTLRSYAKSMLRLCRFLWAIGSSPETMTRREFRAYLRWLDRCTQLPETMKVPNRHDPRRFKDITGHISLTTLDHAESSVRSLYRALEENEVIAVSPVPASRRSGLLKGMNPLDRPRPFIRGATEPGEMTRRRRRRRKRREPLPLELREHLLADTTPRGRAMWRFMLESGPRINEVLTMQPQLMYLDENYVDVLGKGLDGGTRWVPISHAAVDAFLEYQAFLASRGVHLVPGQPVWRSLRRPYGPIGYHAVRAIMATRLAKVSNKAYSPHALRHTAATAMLTELRLSVEQVQKVLGHEFITSTQIYLHADTAEATRSFVEAWRNGRTRPALDVSDLYDADLIADFLGALDD